MAAMQLIYEPDTAHQLLYHHALQAHEAYASQQIPAMHHDVREQAVASRQQQWHDFEQDFYGSSAAETYSGSHGPLGQERWRMQNLTQAPVHAHPLLQSCRLFDMQ